MLLEMPKIQYVAPKSVGEAVGVLRTAGDRASVLAGGSDLLGTMKDQIEPKTPEVLVDIEGIAEARGIEERGGVLRIGAAVRLKELISSPLIQKEYSILSQAASSVGTTQIRNVGTVGGNLCQRPRCPYYRHPDFACIRKGGQTCFAIAGEHRFYHSIFEIGRCVSANPSDLAPALIALGATAVVVSSKEERRVPIREFFLGPERLGETLLQAGEMLLAVEVPRRDRTRQIFLKQRIRKSVDWALVSVGVVARVASGVCEEATIVLGGVGPRPRVADAAGRMLVGKVLDEGLISEAAEAAVKEARPLRNNGYKVSLARALVRRALSGVGG